MTHDPLSRLPKDVRRLVGKAPGLVRATADVTGTVNQLSLRPRSTAIRHWLARDLAETAGRALAMMATLDGGVISQGNQDLIEAHRNSQLTAP